MKKQTKAKAYKKPVMKTVITPKEIRDIEQPCSFVIYTSYR